MMVYERVAFGEEPWRNCDWYLRDREEGNRIAVVKQKDGEVIAYMGGGVIRSREKLKEFYEKLDEMMVEAEEFAETARMMLEMERG